MILYIFNTDKKTVCWQTECNKGFSDEKQGFTDLVRELSMVFKPKNLLLSSAVSPSKYHR